jgi:hypothetical protein
MDLIVADSLVEIIRVETVLLVTVFIMGGEISSSLGVITVIAHLGLMWFWGCRTSVSASAAVNDSAKPTAYGGPSGPSEDDSPDVIAYGFLLFHIKTYL